MVQYPIIKAVINRSYSEASDSGRFANETKDVCQAVHNPDDYVELSVGNTGRQCVVGSAHEQNPQE